MALFLVAYFPDRCSAFVSSFTFFPLRFQHNVSVHSHACWHLSSKRPCHDRIQPDQLMPLTGCDFCDVFGILTLWLFKVGPVW